jgi:Zn-dependent protease with chaperone function
VNSSTGGYYDGVVATRHDVCLTIECDTLRIRGSGFDLCYPLTGVTLTSTVGSIRRTIRLPDGGMCEAYEATFMAELTRRAGKGSASALLHRWEKSVPLVAGSLAVTALLVTLFLHFGIPTLARQAAFAISPAVENGMGRESLVLLDRMMLKPAKLTTERRVMLNEVFRRVATASNARPGCRLEFRGGGTIGANALALPSGIVIITDELVELARHDDEIAAILAHELGHVGQRHALRHVLQNSATALIIGTLTGDLTSITSLAATLPTALVDASFSRTFEHEADDAAIAWMTSAGVPPRRYAEILGRLQAQLDVRTGTTAGTRSAARNYLSTHPDTGERIRRMLAATP